MNKYVKQALVWGILGGFACFVWFLVVYYARANPFYSFWQKLVILLQAVIAYFSIRDFRERYGKEEFSVGEGIMSGLAITLVLSIFCGTLIYIFIQYVHPEMVANQMVELKNYFMANREVLIKGSSLKEFEGNFENINEVTAYTLSLNECIMDAIQGTMFTILVSLTLRKQKEKI